MSNERLKWIGAYASEHKIPYIRFIGDFGTFDSLSQHDDYGSIKGRKKPSFEEDMASITEALDFFTGEFGRNYTPDMVNTLGNHDDDRLGQWEDTHPEVEGLLVKQFRKVLKSYSIRAVPYRHWNFLGGVGFTHFPQTIMNRPYGGKNPENQIANDLTFSAVIGHTHKFKVIPMPKLNGRITVLNLGCALPDGHVEDYAIGALTGWAYGIVDMRIEGKDILGHRFVSMRELQETYGGKHRHIVSHRKRKVSKVRRGRA